jgi:hypothetical protein
MPWNTHKAHPKRKKFPGVTKVTIPGTGRGWKTEIIPPSQGLSL